jgi:hypothetical protein
MPLCSPGRRLSARISRPGGPLELAALLAKPARAALVLVGAESSEHRADASRLLATASLILQRVTGVIGEPLLVPAGPRGLLDAAADAAHILAGLSPRFREQGLGETRATIARHAEAPVTFVRRGTRPGVLAPPQSMTRFSRSLSGRSIR